jgi:hypothetical protein
MLACWLVATGFPVMLLMRARLFLVFSPVLSVVVADAAIQDSLMVEEEVPAFEEVMPLVEFTLGVIVNVVALEKVV